MLTLARDAYVYLSLQNSSQPREEGICLNNLAACYRELGNKLEAKACYERAILCYSNLPKEGEELIKKVQKKIEALLLEVSAPR